MIQNELKRGNYINATFYGQTDQCQVFGLDDKFVQTDVNIKYECHMISGIPLTEEWLLKLGFEKISIGFSINISPFKNGIEYKHLAVDLTQGIYIRQGGKHDLRHTDDIVSIWNIDKQGIISVHQLQNLHFALTGEELTLNNGE